MEERGNGTRHFLILIAESFRQDVLILLRKKRVRELTQLEIKRIGIKRNLVGKHKKEKKKKKN